MTKATTQSIAVIVHLLTDDGTFPNNNHLPLLIYKNAFLLHKDPESAIAGTFSRNNWGNTWSSGIYNYHHYHSTAHEVLGISSGEAKVQLGGPEGVIVELNKGDVIIIPAGVAHKNLGSSDDFKCVGGYAGGRHYDINYGKPGERPGTDENLEQIPLPDQDPVLGKHGILDEYWKKLK